MDSMNCWPGIAWGQCSNCGVNTQYVHPPGFEPLYCKKCRSQIPKPSQCWTCREQFPSRNKLFQHLNWYQNHMQERQPFYTNQSFNINNTTMDIDMTEMSEMDGLESRLQGLSIGVGW